MAKLTRQNISFTQVANEVLNDNNLSFKAKGLYAYLFSKPDEWDFSAHRIKLESSDGRDSVLTALKELEEKGYLQRKKLGNGRTEYHLKHDVSEPDTDIPVLDSEPNTENPTYGKSHGGKTRTISNKEVIKTNILNNNTETSSEVFDWDSYLQSMIDNDKRHIKIIGFYFKTRGKRFDTLSEIQSALKRHVKPAKELVGFPNSKIGEVIRKLNYDFPKFTLETVLKELTK